MAGELRFHLDEHVALAVAEGLRRRGIDATTTHEAGLCSASDDEHLAYALRLGRVIVTNDDDFLRMHSVGVPHAGIAYYEQERHSIGYLYSAPRGSMGAAHSRRDEGSDPIYLSC